MDSRIEVGPFENNDRYSAGTVEVDVEIAFFFPKWDVPKDAPLDLVGSWNAYLNALHEHENGHRDMAVVAACEFLQELNSLASCNTCIDLGKEVNVIAENILELYRQEESDNDRITEHGFTHDVLFPWKRSSNSLKRTANRLHRVAWQNGCFAIAQELCRMAKPFCYKWNAVPRPAPLSSKPLSATIYIYQYGRRIN